MCDKLPKEHDIGLLNGRPLIKFQTTTHMPLSEIESRTPWRTNSRLHPSLHRVNTAYDVSVQVLRNQNGVTNRFRVEAFSHYIGARRTGPLCCVPLEAETVSLSVPSGRPVRLLSIGCQSGSGLSSYRSFSANYPECRYTVWRMSFEDG